MKGSMFCRTFIFIALCLQLGAGGRLYSQTEAIPGKKALKTLTDSLAAQLVRYYVDKEAALVMGAVIKKNQKAGRYEKAADVHELAGMLTADLRSIHNDEHLHVAYNPSMAQELSGNIEDVPGMVAEKLIKDKQRNFGFRKVEILDGNTGYIELSGFSRLNPYSKATATAAFRLLQNASAIIIDLRYGSGGSPDMMTFILSHFYDKEIPVSDIYIRSEKTTLRFHTTPDSTFSDLHKIPVYVLTSHKTFSAAEGFAYTLQRTGRGIVVGEKTRGGAHTVTYRPLSSGFVCDIPFGVASVPGTGDNWEKSGVTPDLPCESSTALMVAQENFFEKVLAGCRDSASIRRTSLQRELALARHKNFSTDTVLLRQYEGVYGVNSITLKNGILYYQKTGMARFPISFFGEDKLRPYGSDDFVLVFERDSSGFITRMHTHYSDGREEHSFRNPSLKPISPAK